MTERVARRCQAEFIGERSPPLLSVPCVTRASQLSDPINEPGVLPDEHPVTPIAEPAAHAMVAGDGLNSSLCVEAGSDESYLEERQLIVVGSLLSTEEGVHRAIGKAIDDDAPTKREASRPPPGPRCADSARRFTRLRSRIR